MDTNFMQAFDALLEKYGELLIGQSDPKSLEKLKVWALYNHIHKTMPALTQHWNQAHPEVRPHMRALFEEVKRLNDTKNASPDGSSN